LIQALASDSRVKVLSSPTILATDNRPARIQVGSEEPIPTGTVTSPELTATSTTIQYRNTGRILTIIPQVNSQGLVHLQIKAEVSERGPNVQIGAASTAVDTGVAIGTSTNTFPSFTTRDAETTAVVQDRETLVIGGIISENKRRERRGLPYLMDIPVVGRFFGMTSDTIQRTELVILITPRVIRSLQEARDVTQEFKHRLSTVARELERMKKEEEARPPEKPVAPPPEPSSQNVPSGRTNLSPAKRDPVSADVSGEAPRESLQRVQFLGNSSGEQTLLFAKDKRPASSSERAQEKAASTWTVQVAAFPERQPAVHLAQRLEERGYDSHIVVTPVKGRTWYRVQVGYFARESEAKELLEMLQAKEGLVKAFTADR
jgi:type II secretory pathway component HofQ